VQPIRVFLVDDHPVVREGLRSLIASFPDLEVVGDAEDAFAIASKVEAARPDVVLLDIRLGNVSGIEAARLLRRNQPSVKVIILTTYDDAEYLQQALAAEVHGYLLKSASYEQLAQAIRAVYRGEKLLSPPLLGKVMEEFGRLARDKSRHESGLSDQELQVLREIAAGATNREIAERLFWSEVTVKRKIQDIIEKLGVANRAQAIAEAIRHGWI
jgi:two-component system, NarL family, response regulator DevR